MTFIIAEDEALRKKLQGITVSDQKSINDNTPREVGVWFGQPDPEIRSQSYPYITIDMIDVVRDPEREHRGKVHLDYVTPEELGGTLVADDWETDWPIPVYIDYQITAYSRHPRHDRAIMAQLLGIKLPVRFGTLNVLEYSSESTGNTVNTYTTRRLDVMSVSKRDVTEQAKRLFMSVITVRVSSEIPLQLFKQLYKVTQINIDPGTQERGGFTNVGPIVIQQ